MARKPNYKFEKLERERRKAAKKQAKLDAKEQARQDAEPQEVGVQDTVAPPDTAPAADAQADTAPVDKDSGL